MIGDTISRIFGLYDSQRRQTHARFKELVLAEICAGRFRLQEAQRDDIPTLHVSTTLTDTDMAYLRTEDPFAFGCIQEVPGGAPRRELMLHLHHEHNVFSAAAIAYLTPVLEELLRACEAKVLRGECQVKPRVFDSGFGSRRVMQIRFPVQELQEIVGTEQGDAMLVLRLVCHGGSAGRVEILSSPEAPEALVKIIQWNDPDTSPR